MRILGYDVSLKRTRAAIEKGLSAINSGGGWFGILREPFGGAFQANIAIDAPRSLLAFSAVFSCVTIIANDIAKLRLKLMEEDDKGIRTEVTSKKSPFLSVLKKPNKFQNRIKFIEQWILSKLLYGNAYVLKVRDARGVVVELYVLDAQRVIPLVAENGDVYYQLSTDHLSGLQEAVTVPASEIIHDMMVSLWHPLVGISPIYACATSATMGNRIQANSLSFFANMSRPSGMLTAPGLINNETAQRLKEAWEQNFTGGSIGRLAVLGDALSYQPMTISATDAQLIDQLKWTVEDVARCFHMPLYKLGGAIPVGNSVEALNQMYFSECLQTLMESAELCLVEGLGLPDKYFVEYDLDGLLRMDTAARYEAKDKAVRGGWMAPNEARAGENLKPVAGGESPYLQQQNFSLAALAKRDLLPNPFVIDKPTSNPTPSATGPAGTVDPAETEPAADAAKEATAQDLALALILKFTEATHAS